MVCLDMNMPVCCNDCIFIAEFSDEEFGCAALPDEHSDYGLAEIENPKIRDKNCPLRDIGYAMNYISALLEEAHAIH